MIGKHADAATVASHRRRIKAIAITDGVLVFAALTAVVITLAVDNAPSVQARELPQPPKVTQPAPVAGPVQPIFGDLPPGFPAFTGVPFDGGKEPVAVVVSQPVRTSRSAARVAAASVPRQRTQTAAPVLGDPPARDAPQNDAEPVDTRDDPLHDDGTFGDGCEQPGTPPRCDPDVPPVGLPPVVVVETPPVVEDEEPPAVPAEEEPPVDEVEVVEPVTEVAGP